MTLQRRRIQVARENRAAKRATPIRIRVFEPAARALLLTHVETK